MAEIKHLDAFEYYYALGSARTYEQVAQKFNKKEKTVRQWGSTEKWVEEVKKLDLKALKENRLRSSKLYTQKVEQYQNILKLSLSFYLEKLKNKEIEIKSIKDLESLMRLDVYLEGLKQSELEKEITQMEDDKTESLLELKNSTNTDTTETLSVLNQITESLNALNKESDSYG